MSMNSKIEFHPDPTPRVGTCRFMFTLAVFGIRMWDYRCGRTPTDHVGDIGPTGLFRSSLMCARHAAKVTRFGLYRHPIEVPCEHPAGGFDAANNRCVIPRGRQTVDVG